MDGGMGEAKAFRLRFPEDEARLPWLPPLLDAFALLDAALARDLAAAAAEGKTLACRRGCFACCRQPIPVTAVEVMGVSWFAVRQVQSRVRKLLARRLEARDPGPWCPFLVEGACAVHPVRPLACREYNVFGRACAPGECVTETRPGDVLPLPRAAQRAAMERLLPALGVDPGTAAEPAERLAFARSGILYRINWPGLAASMAAWDAKRE